MDQHVEALATKPDYLNSVRRPQFFRSRDHSAVSLPDVCIDEFLVSVSCYYTPLQLECWDGWLCLAHGAGCFSPRILLTVLLIIGGLGNQDLIEKSPTALLNGSIL